MASIRHLIFRCAVHSEYSHSVMFSHRNYSGYLRIHGYKVLLIFFNLNFLFLMASKIPSKIPSKGLLFQLAFAANLFHFYILINIDHYAKLQVLFKSTTTTTMNVYKI